jgi:hypothetical protein
LGAEIEHDRSPEERKRADELQVFRAFAKVAPIRVETNSDRSVPPPEPDICCSMDGSRYYFELGEITSQGVARGNATEHKTSEPTGGPFSQDIPFAYLLSSKATKTYVTSGAPVDLLMYYRKQYPPWGQYFAEMANASARDLHALLKENGGPFDRLWVFDSWQDRILLSL